MPDITMCTRKDCPKAKECYRFMAHPNMYQSYSDFLNSCTEEDGYKHFWDMKR